MKHVKKLLIDKDLSQNDLAKIVGVSSAHISYILKGKKKPGLDVLVKIADALDVSLDFIVRGN